MDFLWFPQNLGGMVNNGLDPIKRDLKIALSQNISFQLEICLEMYYIFLYEALRTVIVSRERQLCTFVVYQKIKFCIFSPEDFWVPDAATQPI